MPVGAFVGARSKAVAKGSYGPSGGMSDGLALASPAVIAPLHTQGTNVVGVALPKVEAKKTGLENPGPLEEKNSGKQVKRLVPA